MGLFSFLGCSKNRMQTHPIKPSNWGHTSSKHKSGFFQTHLTKSSKWGSVHTVHP